MHPLKRNVVIGLVGLIISGAFTALALLGTNSDLSVLAMMVAAILAAGVGTFLFVQGWLWASRLARRRETAQSVLVAIGGGLMGLVAAGALAGLAILVLLFYLS